WLVDLNVTSPQEVVAEGSRAIASNSARLRRFAIILFGIDLSITQYGLIDTGILLPLGVSSSGRPHRPGGGCRRRPSSPRRRLQRLPALTPQGSNCLTRSCLPARTPGRPRCPWSVGLYSSTGWLSAA